MRIKEAETEQERQERLRLADKEIEKNAVIKLKLVLIVAITVVIVGLVLKLSGIDVITHTVNIGNPYECKECKTLCVACKEHVNYNADNALKYKISKAVDVYSYKVEASDNIYKQRLYDNYNYNITCDFCKELESECSGCKYTRLSIEEKIEEIINTSGSLCDECRKLGYAECDHDKNNIIEKVYNEIKGNN